MYPERPDNLDFYSDRASSAEPDAEPAVNIVTSVDCDYRGRRDSRARRDSTAVSESE